ncbi:thioredoxin family protein [Bacillus sp. FJAT-47783]|uniref:thioredoxin family protein n=1 Tax=Bacillus sp. FJAT-47783 TaxID=2922712 RepID=UPI001FAE4FCD|nr:thioredoxin family protein [Bacillus sp. FJAT-47783]
MKKILLFGGIIVLLFGLLAFITNYQNEQKLAGVENNPYNKNDLDPATIELLEDPNYQNIILPEELEEKVKNKEDMIVYFFSSTCIHCKNTTPVLMPIAEELNMDIKQYNLLEFEQGWDQYNINSTPTLVQFKDGKEVNRVEGYQEEAFFKELLTEWKS